MTDKCPAMLVVTINGSHLTRDGNSIGVAIPCTREPHPNSPDDHEGASIDGRFHFVNTRTGEKP